MSLKYEPASEPLHISVKQLSLDCRDTWGVARKPRTLNPKPHTLNPKP